MLPKNVHTHAANPAYWRNRFDVIASPRNSLGKPSFFILSMTIAQIFTFGTLTCAAETAHQHHEGKIGRHLHLKLDVSGNVSLPVDADVNVNVNVNVNATVEECTHSLDALLLFSPQKRHQLWRFVSYMLVHTGYLHLLNNVAFQLLLGVPLEFTHRWWQVMAVYLAGVLWGSLANSVSNPRSPLAGASAGVYALLGAHLANLLLHWPLWSAAAVRAECGEDGCSFLVSPTLQLPCVVLLGTIEAAVTVWFQVGAQGASRISSAAHLGGLAGGFLVGIRALRAPSSRWPKLSSYLLAFYAAVALAALAWNAYISAPASATSLDS